MEYLSALFFGSFFRHTQIFEPCVGGSLSLFSLCSLDSQQLVNFVNVKKKKMKHFNVDEADDSPIKISTYIYVFIGMEKISLPISSNCVCVQGALIFNTMN